MALVTQPADGLWTSMPRSNTARQGRALLQSMFANFDANPLNGVRSGVVVTTGLTGSNDLLPFLAGGLQISVAAGIGVAHKSGAGPMQGWLLSTKTVTLTDAPVSNPRNDLIVMRMYDLAAGDTSPDGQPCRIEVITGTPAASPLDPLTPNVYGVYTGIPAQSGLGTGGVAIPIGRAQVATSGTVTLTDLRRGACLLGGPVYFLPGDTVGAAATRSGELSWNATTGVLSVSDTGGVRRAVTYNEPSLARGRVGGFTGSTDLNVTTTEQVMYSATFTAVLNRRYRIWSDHEYYRQSGTPFSDNIYQKLRIISGAVPTATGGTVLRSKSPNMPASAAFLTEPATLMSTWVATASGTFAVSFTARMLSGAGGIAGSATDHTYELCIEDIGL